MALTEVEQSLIAAATRAVQSVSLTSTGILNKDHKVGAAVLTSKGRIFTGVCLAHYTGGPCAEPVAFANAAAAGVDSATTASLRNPASEQLVLCVAVTYDGVVISPCGRCRQQMWDYYPSMDVIVDDGTETRTMGVQSLLPFPCSTYPR